MRKIVCLLIVSAVLGALAAPATARPSFEHLAYDPVGDHNGMEHIDLTALYARQRSGALQVRFEFLDLDDELRHVSGVAWDLGYGGTRYCCTISARTRAAAQVYDFTYWNRCDGCGRTTIELDGSFDAATETITVSIPLDLTPLRPGDVLSGCGYPAEWRYRRCGAHYSGCTSPGMYGYDCFEVRKTFTIR